MNKIHACSVSLLLVTGLSRSTVALAVPPLPLHVSGVVEVDAENVPEGTPVSAVCDGDVYATTLTFLTAGQSVYSLFVPGDDPDTPERDGCSSGGSISFLISLGEQDVVANETVAWASGEEVSVDLTAESSPATSSPPRSTDRHVLSALSAFPNPFNPSVTLSFRLSAVTKVEVVVFDVAGRRLRTLYSGVSSVGDRELRWDGTDSIGSRVASGIYWIRASAASSASTVRVVMVK